MLQEVNRLHSYPELILAHYMGRFEQNTIFYLPSFFPDEVYNCPVREGRRRSRGDARPNTAAALKGGLCPSTGICWKYTVEDAIHGTKNAYNEEIDHLVAIYYG
jgi:hypothetical protein